MGHQRARCRLGRPHEKPKRQRQGPEQGFVIAEQQETAQDNHAAECDEDGGFGAQPILNQPKAGSAQPRRDIHGNAEQQNFLKPHAMHAGGIDRAEGEQRIEAIGIKQPRDQKPRHGRVLRQAAQNAACLSEASAHGRPQPRPRPGRVRERQQYRPAKHQ